MNDLLKSITCAYLTVFYSMYRTVVNAAYVQNENRTPYLVPQMHKREHLLKKNLLLKSFRKDGRCADDSTGSGYGEPVPSSNINHGTEQSQSK